MSGFDLTPADDRGIAQKLRDAAAAVERGENIAILFMDLRPGAEGAGSAHVLVQGDGVSLLELCAAVDVLLEKTLKDIPRETL